jgi:hypothetical protein
LMDHATKCWMFSAFSKPPKSSNHCSNTHAEPADC